MKTEKNGIWEGNEMDFIKALFTCHSSSCFSVSCSSVKPTAAEQTAVRSYGRRRGDTPSLPSLSGFLSSFIFPSLLLFFFLTFTRSSSSNTQHRSHLTFLPPPLPPPPHSLSSLYHPLCHRGNFLPLWQACGCCPPRCRPSTLLTPTLLAV